EALNCAGFTSIAHDDLPVGYTSLGRLESLLGPRGTSLERAFTVRSNLGCSASPDHCVVQQCDAAEKKVPAWEPSALTGWCPAPLASFPPGPAKTLRGEVGSDPHTRNFCA